MAETSTENRTDPAVHAPRLRFLSDARFWLGIAVVTFAVLDFGFSGFRLLEIHTGALDLGVFQQALWSGSHGGPYFEAPDYQSAGYPSFFLVHLAPVMVLLAPVYGALPSAFTLFAIQSAVVAVAAVPLYLLTREMGGRPQDGFLVAGLYLVWAPTLASSLYDFHLESFVPAEYFLLAWLWTRRQYVLAAPVVLLAYCTAEYVPIFVVFLGVFFVISQWRPAGTPLGKYVLSYVRKPDLLVSVALVGSALAAFAITAAFQSTALNAHLGFVSGAGPSPPGLQPSRITEAFGLSWSNLGNDFFLKAGDWLLFYALVAFLPLAAPRTQVAIAPWIAFTMLAPTDVFLRIGFQYEFLVAGPLFLGVAAGWLRVRALLEQPGTPADRSPTAPTPRRHFRVRRRYLLMAGGLLLVANVAFSPVNPLMELSGGVGAGYLFTLHVPPGYSEIRALVATLPSDAPLLASPDLFPFVANDLHAYVIPDTDFPQTNANLPYDVGHLPPAVLLAQNEVTVVPSWLGDALYNASNYRVAEVAWNTPAGAVVLFEGSPVASVGWSAPVYYGTPPASDQTFPSTSFLAGGAGYYARPASSPNAVVIATVPGETGTLWYGPYTCLLPGNYTLSVELSARPWSSVVPVPGSSPVLKLLVTAWGQNPLFARPLNYTALATPGTTLEFPFNVTSESLNVEIVGQQIAVTALVQMAQVTVAVDAAP